MPFKLPLRQLLALALSLLALGGLASASPAAAPWPAALEAPARLRPGDAFLAWAAFARPPEAIDAGMLGPAGRVATRIQVFEAGALAGAGAESTRQLYGILAAIPQGAAAGSYSLVLRGAFSAPGAPASAEPAGGTSTAGPDVAAEIGVAAAGDSSPVAPRFGLYRPFAVESRDFASETIPLNAANTALRTSVDPRKDEEARRLFELLDGADPGALFLEGIEFALPVGGSITSANYGDRRVYAYAGGGSETSAHAGIDLAAPTGTPVLACARGRVVFAAERIVTGKTLVLEHLPGLFSLYMHLSALEAEPGELVERGMRIGAVGSTGLSTGPHLHWELRAAGSAVDTGPWLASPPLDKGRLADMMSALIEGR